MERTNYDGWIPVSAQMPKPGRRVLVYHNGFEGWRVGVGMNLDFNNMFQVFSGKHEAWTERVTHWMPLPDQPEGTGYRRMGRLNDG